MNSAPDRPAPGARLAAGHALWALTVLGLDDGRCADLARSVLRAAGRPEL